MYQENILHRIRLFLAILEAEVKMDNSNGEFSINVHAENVLLKVLNVAFGLDLHNVNYEEGKKYPAIDLRDDAKKVAFQITSTGTQEKVVHTLRQCVKHDFDKKYDHLYFYFLKGKEANVKDENDRISKEKGGFDNSRIHFLDNADFYKYLNERNDIDILEQICKLLEKQFGGYQMSAEKTINDQKDISKKNPSKNKSYRDQYRNIWNKPLFLTDLSTNRICLKDTYIPLSYEKYYKKSEEGSSLMDELLKKGGHLVLGHPGIGKSALISWMLNKSVDERIDQALVYRMARFSLSSYKVSGLPASTLLQEQMGVDGNCLRNRIVFLDGFDECALNGDERERFLGELSSDWDDIEGLTWVITCRLNYISDWALKRLTQYSHYTLLPFNEGQIEKFFEKYSSTYLECNKSCDNGFFIEASKAVKNSNNKGILGIPLILYMVSALQIQVRDDSSLVQIYDHIFDRENKNSIYCKVYDNHGRNEKVFEKRYLIHEVSREIALWMFCNNASEALIDGSSYKIIEKKIEAREIQKRQEEESVLDNLHAIGSYIIQLTKEIRHIEGENEICFVHRTMFEYFLVEGFVEKAIDEIKKAEDDNSATNNLSSIISTYFYATEMTINMESYLKEKLEQKKTDLKYTEWEMACLQILKRGVCEFVKNIQGSSVCKARRYEAIIFKNICILLQIIKEITCFKEAIFDNVIGCYEDVSSAIRHSSAEGIKLCLNNFMLKGANLQGAYLCDYKFRKAILCGARMSGANLKNADLQKADLSHADLCEVDLNNASLSGVIFNKTKITDVKVGWRQVAAIKESGFGKCNFSSIIYENKVYKSKKSFLEEIGKNTAKNANKN